MQVVDNWVVTEALNTLLHCQILVDDYLESASHLLIVYFVFLSCQFLLLQVDYVKYFGACVQLKAFMDLFFNLVHLLHHKGFLALTAFHILDTLLLDTIENLLLCGLVDVVEDL